MLGPAERRVNLPKNKQIRRGRPAKMSLTIFGEELPKNEIVRHGDEDNHELSDIDREMFGDPPNGPPKIPGVGDGENNPEGDVGGDVVSDLVGEGIPKSIARHGPGFLNLTGEEKAQIRRLHHNLGHPTAERLAKFMKERHAEHRIIQGVLDFQCDSCSRDLTLHDRLPYMMTWVSIRLLAWTQLFGQIIGDVSSRFTM